MERHDGASDAEYEQLRRHLLGPHREHPVAHPSPRAPVPPTTQGQTQRQPQTRAPEAGASGDGAPVRVSVMSWLVDVGHAVARKLRGQPRSPMVRLHPRR